MLSIRVHLYTVVAIATIILQVQGEKRSTGLAPNLSFEASICRLLNDKFVASHPWTIYPIVYEPIQKGKLTIWSGISSLPTSEFKCSVGDHSNSTRSIILDFDTFSNKLEWTFFDVNKGSTYNGYSINSCQGAKYKVAIKVKKSYTECNTIDSIAEIRDEGDDAHIQTICNDCTQVMLTPIKSQIREFIKQEVSKQILDNLYWQLAQLVVNQHFQFEHHPLSS